MLSIGSAVLFSSGGAGRGVTLAPVPQAPPAPTSAQKAIADANAIALRAKTIADANAYAASVAKNNPIMRALAPVSAATAPATTRKLASSIQIERPARSIWGGGAEGGGGGGAPSQAPSETPSDAGLPRGPIDYAGTGYTPNRGGDGNIYSGGYYGGGGAPPGSSWSDPGASGQVPGMTDPSLVQSAGAGNAPVPQQAATLVQVSPSEWPWIIGLGVAAIAGYVIVRKMNK